MQNIQNTGSTLKPKHTQPRKLLDLTPEVIIKQLEHYGMLNKEEFQFIIQSSISVLKFEPNIIKTLSPAVIVGDIHGQFFDLLTIFKRHGFPPNTKYIFLGDYVDRGEFNIQVITLIFWLKLKYPKHIYLLRGNHQCRILTSSHNFRSECKSKYNIKIYELVVILFEVLPICCLLDQKYFLVHAGISPSLNFLQQIQKINRFCEIPEKGILCDLLWSDPTDEEKQQWVFNTMRSCSYYYSREHAINFMKKNNLELIIRGHQVQLSGYKYLQFKNTNKKNVLTIFSAPNYCDKYNNLGAVALVSNNQIKIDTFKYVEHPYVLPNRMNIFEWSIQVISNEAVKILIELVKSRLMNQQDKNRGDEDTIDDIREKIELYEKIQGIRRALQQKRKQQKLGNSREKKYKIENEKQLDPSKCLLNILMFMCEKETDLKDEAMPSNQKIQNSIQQEKKLFGGVNWQTKINNKSISEQNIGKQQGLKTFEYDPSLNSKRGENSKEKENRNCTFGPKIQNFIKIFAKKK